jgi:hypothetical protein
MPLEAAFPIVARPRGKSAREQIDDRREITRADLSTADFR